MKLVLLLLAPTAALRPVMPRSALHVTATPSLGELGTMTVEDTLASPRFRKGVKQVCTLGPKTFGIDKIEALFLAGADVFRLNLSHGREEKAAVAALIREVEAKYNHPIGILADLQGPKQRMGMFEGEVDGEPSPKFMLETGSNFRMDSDPTPGDTTRVQLPHPEILAALEVGKTLLLDDGKLRLEVTGKGDGYVDTIVRLGGLISSRKGVNTPDVIIPVSPITPKDKLDLEFILKSNVDWVALSFVQVAADRCRKQGHDAIAKLLAFYADCLDGRATCAREAVDPCGSGATALDR